MIRQSKTDSFHKGHVLNLTPTQTSTCPVKAFQQYAAIIPLHCPSWTTILSWQIQTFKQTQTLLQQADSCPQLYCTHSFRIGVATTSAAAGLPPWLIQTLGRWNGDAYLTYVWTPSSLITSVPTILARTIVPQDVIPMITSIHIKAHRTLTVDLPDSHPQSIVYFIRTPYAIPTFY